MGASNFGRANASKSFEVLMGYEVENEETGEMEYYQPEQWECDEFRSELKLQLEKLPYSDRDLKRGGDEIGLCVLSEYKNYGDIEVGVRIECFMEIGYHEGGRLDWEIEYYANQSEYDKIDLSDIEAEFEYSSDLRVGLQKILSKKALAWMEKTKEEMIKAVEEVYEQNS